MHVIRNGTDTNQISTGYFTRIELNQIVIFMPDLCPLGNGGITRLIIWMA